MKIKIYYFLFPIFCFYSSFAQKTEKPNFILIYADDAGYGDFGFTGSNEFKTPNIDKLANQGMQFSNAYVTSPICGPSRAGLLTGRYQQRFGFIYNNVPFAIDQKAGLYGSNMGLPKDEKTIADYLNKFDYKSMIIGKWHQGHGEEFHPMKRGFDEFYGFLGGARSFFEIENPNEEARLWKNEVPIPEPGGYLTDKFGEEATIFIEKNKDEPFFLYLAFNAVHNPLEAKREDLNKFPNLKGTRKTLAAMTLSMDDAIGKVLNKLKELGLEKDTIIIFTNDNGGPSWEGMNNAPYSGSKATCLEGGVRVPFIMKWSGKIPEGHVFRAPISTLDILPTFVTLAGGVLPDDNFLNGKNLMPYIQKEIMEPPHETLYWEFDGHVRAIRHKNWKLISLPDRPPELYNLDKDITESNNLAHQNIEITKKLMKKLFDWQLSNSRPRWQLKVLPYDKLPVEMHEKYKRK